MRGVHIDYATFRSCFGRINADCIAIMFGPDLTPEESDRIAEEKERAFRDIVRQNVPLARGRCIARGIAERGIGLAVGSSGPRKMWI